MGAFYTNLVVRGPTAEEVLAALSGRDAFVSPRINKCCVVYDRECDEQDTDVIGKLAGELSGRFDCPVLAVMNHDDDILWYQLYWIGELSDEYDSCPSYFDSDAEPTGPGGGDAEKLCAAFGSDRINAVSTILNCAGNTEEGGYTFESERHAALAESLDIPRCSIGFSFATFEDGQVPDDMKSSDFLRSKSQ